MKLPKLNVALARKVKKHILAEPKRLDMTVYTADVRESDDNAPACGTVGCIAGWTCLLSAKPKNWWQLVNSETTNFYGKAQKYLGLTDDEANELFLNFNKETGKAGAKEVARKIDALIAARKKGEEFLGL